MGHNQKLLLWLASIFLHCGAIFPAFSQEEPSAPTNDTITSGQNGNYSLRGYIKYLPFLNISKGFDHQQFNHLLHNRLNFRLYASQSLILAAELRTRVFSGENIRNNYLVFGQMLGQDDGLVDASFAPVSNQYLLAHTISDRFYVDYTRRNWNLRVGRQRVNWGVNMVFNPNDLFNTWSFFDFDYEERPGSDAIRATHYLSGMNRLEVVVSPAREIKNSTAAALYGFNRNGYDFQTIAGYYRNRMAIGGGWAGNLRQLGFKGEFTWFRDLYHTMGVKPSNLVGGLGISHRFGNEVFVSTEYLYNGGRNRFGLDIPPLLTQPLSPDNLSFSEHTIFVQALKPISPVFSIGLSGMGYLGEKTFFVSPLLTYSLATNLDAALISQIFAGPEESGLAQAGYLLAGTLKWSF